MSPPRQQRWHSLTAVLQSLIFVAAGIALLSYAADAFVDGAARLAVRFDISPVIVGAVIVGFGTSAPEMLVSGLAAGRGDLDLGVGNVIGSNVANITLVLGVAALVTRIGVGRPTLRRELPLSVASVLLFAILIQGGLNRIEGTVLLVGMIAALVFLGQASDREQGELDDELDNEYGDPADVQVGTEWLRTLGGLFGTVLGAWLLVEGALDLAERWGLTGGFIGLTMVAIGTSLPELVTAVAAARMGHTEMLVGNLLGSNIFNSLAVGAIISLVGPGPIVDGNLTGLATVIMIGAVLLAGVFMITKAVVVRWEAAALLLAYFISMPFTISDATECEAGVDTDCVEVGALGFSEPG